MSARGILAGFFSAMGLFCGDARAAGIAARTTMLDMNTDPASLGWSVQKDGNGSHSIANGILTIDSRQYYELVAPSSAWFTHVSNFVGWEVEARMRQRQPLGSDIVLWMHDWTYVTKVEIHNKQLAVHAGDNRYEQKIATQFSANDFHTYLVRAVGTQLDILIDDVPVYSITRGTPLWGGGGTRTFFFGDGWWSTPTVTEWDYFRVTLLPEPALSGWFGLLAACLLMRIGPRHRNQIAVSSQ